MRVTNDSGVAAVLVSIVLIIAGCSGSTDEPAGLATTAPPQATSSTPPEEPSPTPTSTAPPALEELRTMELPPGLVIEELPDVAGADLAALEAYVRWEVEYWRALLENEVDDAIDDLATEEVVAMLADQVEAQADNGFRLGGTLRFVPTVEGATEGAAVVTGCFDQSEVMTVRDGVAEESADSADNPQFTATADLSFSGTDWIVTAYQTEIGPC